jgi:hypothetical protein
MIPMSEKLHHLKPGDLITADFMNAILDALSSLDARLAAAEKRLAKLAGRSPARRRATKRRKKS